MPEVLFRNYTRRREPAAAMRRFAQRAKGHIPQLAGESVEIAIVGPRRMRTLNARFRGKDAPTDVLSFAYGPAGGAEPFGSVVICAEIAEKQAAETGITYIERLNELILHSLLHITGSDHETPEQHRAMERRRKRIAAKMKE